MTDNGLSVPDEPWTGRRLYLTWREYLNIHVTTALSPLKLLHCMFSYINLSHQFSRPLEKYIEAATRQNTPGDYRSAIEHFEVEWRGVLPAAADSVARYLAEYAETLDEHVTTAPGCAGKWHTEQDFLIQPRR